ncbi:MAG: glycosyltransferase family 39 protein [Chloroflexia bacterium]
MSTIETDRSTEGISESGSLIKRLWRARGFFGGIAAIALAYLGQQAILVQRDDASAMRYYLAAGVVLVLSLLYPSFARFRRKSQESVGETALAGPPPPDGQLPIASLDSHDEHPAGNGSTDAVITQNGHLIEEMKPLPARATTATLTSQPSRIAWHQTVSYLRGLTKSRPLYQAAIGKAATRLTARTEVAGPAEVKPRKGPWARWQDVRERLGWRFTVAGLLLTLVLTVGAIQVLVSGIGYPSGGWLWALALLALVLTFAGQRGWTQDESPLAGYRADFFARGVPSIPLRWEVLLAGIMLVTALALRIYNLDGLPAFFGDEGEQGLAARAIFDGSPVLIFGTGWWDIPNLPFYVWAALFRLFGDGIVGVRIFSVIGGMLMLWYVYRLARLLWGPRAGLIAGSLLAVTPLALEFSRVANVTAGTGALWAAGFFYFFMALRYGRWSDWVLSGILWSLSMYFYPAGKLIVPLLGMIGLYCLVRWRMAFLKRYLLGFVLLGAAFALAFLPYLIFSIQDNWQAFTRRSNETFIFSPHQQFNTFVAQGLQYDPAWAVRPLYESVLSNPLPWVQAGYRQMQKTTEALYRRGDTGYFYKIGEHNGSMLSPLLAVLVILGLAYALWKIWDPRFAIISMWFWVGILSVALTDTTPNALRLICAWSAVMLFPAALLDRIAGASWPLSLRFAKRWSALPLACLLLFVSTESVREYFGYFPTTCPPYWHIEACESDAQARAIRALGDDYKAYVAGAVDPISVFGFNYISTRFIARGVEGTDVRTPADVFPLTDNNGKGVAFLVYNSAGGYLRLAKEYYPGGTEEVITTVDGRQRFTMYKLTREQMADFHTVLATYTSASGRGAVSRYQPGLGTLEGSGAAWSPPLGMAYPLNASWEGGLVAPAYGPYTFTLSGTASNTLEIDGRPLVSRSASDADEGGKTESEVSVVLAAGVHHIRLSGVLQNSDSTVHLVWSGERINQDGTAASQVPIDARFLYNGPTGGLTAEVGPLVDLSVLTATGDQDFFGGQLPYARYSQPFIGFRDTSALFGGSHIVARWRGTLQAPVNGEYSFDIWSSTPASLFIDGEIVIQPPTNPGPGFTYGSVNLPAGPHEVELRYAWGGGPGQFEWSWSVPAEERVRELVPPAVLQPAQRSWLSGELEAP